MMYIPEGEGPWNPPPEILKLNMVIIYMLHVLNVSMCHQNFVPDCIRSDLRECKFKIFLGGGHAPSRHAHVSDTTIILLSSVSPHLKILYETLHTIYGMTDRHTETTTLFSSLIPRPPQFLPSVCVHNNTRE